MGSQQSQNIVPFVLGNEQVNKMDIVNNGKIFLKTPSIPGEYKICLKNNDKLRFEELIGIGVNANAPSS